MDPHNQAVTLDPRVNTGVLFGRRRFTRQSPIRFSRGRLFGLTASEILTLGRRDGDEVLVVIQQCLSRGKILRDGSPSFGFLSRGMAQKLRTDADQATSVTNPSDAPTFKTHHHTGPAPPGRQEHLGLAATCTVPEVDLGAGQERTTGRT
jgi:hypothetical protein